MLLQQAKISKMGVILQVKQAAQDGFKPTLRHETFQYEAVKLYHADKKGRKESRKAGVVGCSDVTVWEIH